MGYRVSCHCYFPVMSHSLKRLSHFRRGRPVAGFSERLWGEGPPYLTEPKTANNEKLCRNIGEQGGTRQGPDFPTRRGAAMPEEK